MFGCNSLPTFMTTTYKPVHSRGITGKTHASNQMIWNLTTKELHILFGAGNPRGFVPPSLFTENESPLDSVYYHTTLNLSRDVDAQMIVKVKTLDTL